MFGEEVHEGWNYYDMKDLTAIPKYGAFRLFSNVTKGCDDIGEIRLIGHEVIDVSTDDHSCETELITYTTDPTTQIRTGASQNLGETVSYMTS